MNEQVDFMTNLPQKIKEWNSQFTKDKSVSSCKSLLKEMHEYDETEDISIIERIVLLINQCVIIDAIGDDNIEIENIDFSRNDILEQIQVYFEEYNSSSLIDVLSCEASTAFKEQIAYVIALLLYKVHNYEEAAELFRKSRIFSTKLQNCSNPNGLKFEKRIQRDIYYTYCCEYKGTHIYKKEELIRAIKILVGDDDKPNYWERFKTYCFEKLYADKYWTEEAGIEKNIEKAIEIISEFASDDLSVFSRLLKNKNFNSEYKEAIHAFAHCLNEINSIISDEREMTEAEADAYLEERSFIRFLSRKLIDSLGENYATCQSTIRAEQGRIRDAINILHQIDQTDLVEADIAELNFYQLYFESLFSEHPDLEYEKDHDTHGDIFCSYCNSIVDSENGKDGLLHFHVVSLRQELKLFVENILNSENKNETFLSTDNFISHSDCYTHYEYLRRNHFSIYANSQIVSERERLINIYRIIRSLQSLNLPLVFDANAPYDEKIDIMDAIEDLYELCHKVNILANNQKDVDCSALSQTTDDPSTDHSIICIDGIYLEIVGKPRVLFDYLKNNDIKYSIARNLHHISKHIIVIDDNWYQKCLSLYKQYEGSYYHIYYIYDAKTQSPDNDNFNGTPIVGLHNVDLVFLFSYIYASVESIVSNALNPEPIYILAPLKNSSTYLFQGAESMDLINCPIGIDSRFSVLRGGMGISYRQRSNKSSEIAYNLKFINNNVKDACVNILKFENNRLYVLRGDKLVPKTRVNTEHLVKLYLDYSVDRKNSLPKIHPGCCKETSSTRCCCIYCEINDSIGDFTLSKKDACAGTKLKRFLRLACEEDMAWNKHLFLIEDSYTLVSPKIEYSRKKEISFQLCLFNKDIREFIHENCFKEIVNIEEITDTKSDIAKIDEKPIDQNTEPGVSKKKKTSNKSAKLPSERINDLIFEIKIALGNAETETSKGRLKALIIKAEELDKELSEATDLEDWTNRFGKIKSEFYHLQNDCFDSEGEFD